MNSKFWYLVGVSLKKKVKTKWFLIANIILLIVITCLINMDNIIHFFGGDFNDTVNVIVLDKSNLVGDIFEKNLNSTNTLLRNDYKTKVEITTKSEEDLKKEINDSNKIAIIFDEDDSAYIKATIMSKEKIDTMYYQTLVQALASTKTEVAMNLTTIDFSELNRITSSIPIDRVILDEEAKSEEESMAMIMGTVFPTVILPFFMLVVFLVQMLGSEINEEKSTRSMEIIISNVSPKTHFFSKILASNIFVIGQGILLFLYAFIGLLIRNSIGITSSASSITDSIGEVWQTLSTSGLMDKMYYIIPLTLILMVLSFLAYSLVAGILASMTVNVEDFQQIQTPIMLVCLLSYYLAIMAGMFEGSTIIRILSYLPFISCLLAPALLVIGQITVIDVLISIIALILFIFIAIKYGLRIYKVGILNYSTDKMWYRLFKAVKSK
mgnify:FL=1